MVIVNNIIATVHIIIVVVTLFASLYIWHSGKKRERLYVIVPLLINPVNALFVLIDVQLETASWFWAIALIINLIAFMAICLVIGYLWYTNKISTLLPSYLFILVLMSIFTLIYLLLSIFSWQLQL